MIMNLANINFELFDLGYILVGFTFGCALYYFWALKLKKEGVKEQEFLRCKEQAKTSYIFASESVYNQMTLYGRYLLLTGKEFNQQQRMQELEDLTLNDVQEVIEETFNILGCATATVGSKRTAIKV